MSIPILYKGNEEDFSTMGLGTLKDASSALVTEERNGVFELEMEYPTHGAMINEIKNDRLIKVDASPSLKGQRFKIVRITKPAKGMVKIYGEHVSYLSQDLQLKPEVTFSGDAIQALQAWERGIVDEHPFSVYSDVLTTGEGKWTIDAVDSARRALGGVSGSILDTYRGEYRFDNYHISLLKQRGTEDGALISYGKNLVDLEQEEEIANTYTSVYPYAVVRTEGEEDTIVSLPEYYIDSEHVNNFARRKIMLLDLSGDEESGEVITEETLRERATAYIDNNNVGVPKVNLTVNFMDLSKTLEYKDLRIVENVELCDYVWIYFEDLDIKHRAKVIKTTWDVLLDRYKEIELGEPRTSLAQSVSSTIDGKMKPVEERLQTVQITANGKNKIYRGAEEPTKALKPQDLWYKPVGGETEMYIFTGTIWELVISTGVNNEITERLEEAKQQADTAKQNAENVALDLEEGTSFYKHTNDIGLASKDEDGSINSIINLGSDGTAYIGGENIVLDGNTIVDGTFTVTDEIFAPNMNIDKFTVGTVDAGEVSLINLNADSISGGTLNLALGLQIGNENEPVLYANADGEVQMNVDSLLINSFDPEADSVHERDLIGYLRYSNGIVEIGEEGAEVVTQFGNDEWTMLRNDERVMWLEQDIINIQKAHFFEQMQVGNFAFVPRANGSMDLKQVVN